MRKETQARELALQALYQRDLVEDRSAEELHLYCAERGGPEVAQIACELVEGCIEHQPVLDGIIRRTARNWELDRMATSDRNILRLGTYELLFRPQTPPKVAMNEAIELAK
ncbi:MAG: transcription antitermination factor NusB, partial [Candidatus Brocadiia bacterium]